MSRTECLRLLASHHLGRLAFVVGDQLTVLPVNYGVEADVLVFRTGEGTELDAARGKVALEVDDFDEDARSGWSVVVQGIGDEITDTDDWFAERLRSIAVPTWSSGLTDRYLRITPSRVSGRRLPENPTPTGVRRMIFPSWVPGDPGHLLPGGTQAPSGRRGHRCQGS